MDFPEYVPAAVRERITALFEGLAETSEAAKRQLERIGRQIEGTDNESLNLARRRERQRFAEGICNAKKGMDCLQRLANDEGMRKVYDWLAKKKFTDEQQRDFIISAWVAHQDFGKCREDLAKAMEKAGEIAKIARKLAQKIEGFTSLGIEDEKGAIPARLGDIHRALQGRGLAPFTQWLETLAQAFDGFDKNSAVFGSYLVKAATPTQEHSELTTYVRAFVESLRVYGFPLYGASEYIAITTDIVLCRARDEATDSSVVRRIINETANANKKQQ